MPIDESYNDVPSRIVEFREKYELGTLQAEVIHWPTEALPFLAVKAYAYRSPQDERPGIGLAYERVPGKTNFTRDSELQNAETSAWGRAIVAVGAADTKKGIASAEDVRNRNSEGGGRTTGRAAPAPEPTSPAPSTGTETGGVARESEASTSAPPVAGDLEALWKELTTLTKGDWAKARRAIRDTNEEWARGFTARDDHKATVANLTNAISFIKEG